MYNVGIFPLILHSVTCHLPFPSTIIASQSNHSQVATAYSSQPLLRHAFETRSFFCFTELRDGACLGTRRCMQVWAWSPALTNTHTHIFALLLAHQVLVFRLVFRRRARLNFATRTFRSAAKFKARGNVFHSVGIRGTVLTPDPRTGIKIIQAIASKRC